MSRNLRKMEKEYILWKPRHRNRGGFIIKELSKYKNGKRKILEINSRTNMSRLFKIVIPLINILIDVDVIKKIPEQIANDLIKTNFIKMRENLIERTV